METLPKKAILCDDDAILRSVIAQMMDEVGFEVVGQAESPDLGFDELVRTKADVVVLDLALRGGHGEHMLQRIHEERPGIKVIVFSAYVGDPMRLLDAGASAVVEKPDFVRLEEVLTALRDEPEGSRPNYRRQPPRETLALPQPAGLTLSGLEPWRSFRNTVGGLHPGDAVLAFDVLPTASLNHVWDDVYRIDYRLAVARAAVRTGRDQDRVSLSPQGFPVMLIVAGHPEAPSAIYDRVATMWEREVAAGLPVASFAHVLRGTPPATTLDRTIAKLANDCFEVDRPLHMA